MAGLVLGTFLADAAAFLAIDRMTPTHGRTLALAVLGLAYGLSIATCLVLWAQGRGGGDDDEGGDGEPPEPPWWPEFERAFREYDSRRGGPRPREPAGRT